MKTWVVLLVAVLLVWAFAQAGNPGGGCGNSSQGSCGNSTSNNSSSNNGTTNNGAGNSGAGNNGAGNNGNNENNAYNYWQRDYVENVWGNFDINDDVTCMCEKLEGTADADDLLYTFKNLTGCTDAEIATDGHACEKGNELSLDILHTHTRCYRAACSESSDEQKDRELRKCVAKMRDVIENWLQFSIPRTEAQVARSCECESDYANAAQPEATCDVNHVANCDIRRDGDDVKECMNVEQIIKQQGCCSMTDKAEKDTCYKQVAEIMKYKRIFKYCSADLKQMLSAEDVGNTTCQETTEYKKTLITSCDNNCWFDLKVDWDEADEEFYTDHHDYSNHHVCLQFSRDVNDKVYTFQAESLYYKGRREVWRQSIDICTEYKSSGELPPYMKASPYPRPFLTDAQFKEIVKGCCNLTKEEYVAMQADFPNDTIVTLPYYDPEASNHDIRGLKEAICLNDQDVVNDFGFVSGLLRSLMKIKTKDCWEVAPGKCTFDAAGDAFGVKCENPISEANQPFICDEQSVNPKSFFWFLTFSGFSKEDKAWALKACAEGAEFGKSATALAGLSIGVESQMKALSSTYPTNYKTLAFVAMHHCGVIAALEANNYYQKGPGLCNQTPFPATSTC